MGHNYSRHFNNNKHNNVNELPVHQHCNVNPEEVVEQKEEILEPTEETTNVVNYVKGVVSGCKMLNVRKESSKESDVITILNEDSEVQIDESETSDEFYKIVTPTGVEGYCMKKFIIIK